MFDLTRRSMAALLTGHGFAHSPASMSLAPVVSPYQPINGLTGLGLNKGFLFIGVDGSDPEVSPQACFWDAAGQVPAAQPIAVLGGYPMYLGSPARIYTAATYSIRARDASGSQVFYESHAIPAPNVGNGVFNTMAAAKAANVPPAYQSTGIQTLGYYAAGDGGGAAYLYAPVQGAGAGKFQSADGAWWQLVDTGAVNVRVTGARGDGATDDTVAIQTAINIGRGVYVPAVASYYKLSAVLAVTTAGQEIHGDGAQSRLVQTGINPNATVFVATAARVTFRNLHATPSTTLAGITDGFGFTFSGADRGLVSGCRVSGMKRGGVLLLNSNNCTVENNFFVDSVVPNDRSVPQSQTGYDVSVYGTSSYNTVSGNQCISGCGMGVSLHTNTAGVKMAGNVVIGNTIRNQPVYGIEVYQSGGVQIGFNNGQHVISGNYIENISGSIDTGANNFYGAGIYIASSDDLVVSSNYIKNTNTDRSHPFLGAAVPAAIAVSGIGNISITGNTIDKCYWGIASEGTAADTTAGEGTAITGNVITNADKLGIVLVDCQSANVVGNRLSGAGSHGIFAAVGSTTIMDDFVISANRIQGFGAGIETNNTTPINRVVVADNVIRDHSNSGISLSATIVQVHNNTIVSAVAGSIGISMTTAVTGGYCEKNYINVVSIGVVDDGGGAARTDDNEVLTAATAYATSFRRALDTASATPSVKGKKWYSTGASATPITDFADGYQGQVIQIRALGNRTLVNGNLALSGGVDFAMSNGDQIMLINEGGSWQELARMKYR